MVLLLLVLLYSYPIPGKEKIRFVGNKFVSKTQNATFTQLNTLVVMHKL
jgi:hypothetical protein